MTPKAWGGFSKGAGSPGTGVGLYLIRVLVEQMGGEASFRAGQGFEVQLLLVEGELGSPTRQERGGPMAEIKPPGFWSSRTNATSGSLWSSAFAKRASKSLGRPPPKKRASKSRAAASIWR